MGNCNATNYIDSDGRGNITQEWNKDEEYLFQHLWRNPILLTYAIIYDNLNTHYQYFDIIQYLNTI